MYARLFQEAAKSVDVMCWSIENGLRTTEFECEKAEYVFETILGTMMDLGIIDNYDGELLHEFCQEMNKNN